MEGAGDASSAPQDSPAMSPQQDSLDTSQDVEKKTEQSGGVSFARIAGKVATITKLGQPASTSPTNSRMNF
ncbi:hypothetical protein EVAR_94959_1 [Eumeta japonica]|uniref:Uncharacterized protein n=1 Tax=Eumeta variegata TaxID=151549 RepID=A0A4C1UVT7_EUMVA|nr:hypothetical protein EVAR_94959_1 [Eumeta japonica]